MRQGRWRALGLRWAGCAPQLARRRGRGASGKRWGGPRASGRALRSGRGARLPLLAPPPPPSALDLNLGAAGSGGGCAEAGVQLGAHLNCGGGPARAGDLELGCASM